MNYQKGLCSICCTAYKHYPFLEECIQSIWDNNYKNIEIITIDDGSHDGTNEKLKELQKISPCPIIIIEQENTGNIALNCNRAFQKAHGEFVTFIDLDDILCPNAISEKINLMTNNSNIAFIANSKIIEINSKSKELATISLNINTKNQPTLNELLQFEFEDLGTFYTQGTLFRSDIINKIGAFDEDMTGDDIVLRTKIFRFLQNNPKYQYEILNSVAFKYRKHENNVHKNILRQVKIVAEYYQRYWPNCKFPPKFLKWIFLTIKNESYEKAIEMFTYSEQMKKLQSTKHIQNALKSKKRFEQKKFYDYIFRVEDYGIRKKIIIFNFIKITISK